jgi:hypothetical protein
MQARQRNLFLSIGLKYFIALMVIQVYVRLDKGHLQDAVLCICLVALNVLPVCSFYDRYL